MTTPAFEISDAQAQDVGGIQRYVVAVDGFAVLSHRSNGQSFYMTYSSERGARVGLARAMPTLPDAYVHDKGRS